MDTLDAKTRIMNEIDSIDVQVQALQEKISELHSRKNQYKEAYSAIIGAEQQAERLLAGLLKPADIGESEIVEDAENVWEASAEDEAVDLASEEDDLNPLPVFEQEASLSESDPLDEEFGEDPDDSEVNGRRKIHRQVPSFLRQYL